MGINKEYRCLGHGAFESADEPPVCPHGCTAVERQFRTPVGYIGQRSKNIDDTYQKIANDFGLSDMNTHGGTTAARVKTKQQREAEMLEKKLRHRFAPLPKGGTFNAETKQIIGGSASSGAMAGIAAEKAVPLDGEGRARLDAARELYVQPVRQVSDIKHTTIIKRDPDKESMKKVRSG